MLSVGRFDATSMRDGDVAQKSGQCTNTRRNEKYPKAGKIWVESAWRRSTWIYAGIRCNACKILIIEEEFGFKESSRLKRVRQLVSAEFEGSDALFQAGNVRVAVDNTTHFVQRIDIVWQLDFWFRFSKFRFSRLKSRAPTGGSRDIPPRLGPCTNSNPNGSRQITDYQSKSGKKMGT